MIMRLAGKVIDNGLDWMLVDVNGVGYRIGAALSLSSNYVAGDEIVVWTHQVNRDDKVELYGFESKDALELFWKLIGVNGVGPKVAQKILGVSNPDEIRKNVMEGSVDFLTRVPGVGKKTAQKIVLELKGSLVMDEELPDSSSNEVIEALASLGYPVAEAREMAGRVPEDLESIEDKIKAALTVS